MLDYYVEYCRTKHDRRGRFLPFREAVKLFDTEAAGYCSLYLFRKEDILPFRAAQSSKGLAQVPVYAERLWIDIDREDNIPLARAETDIVRRHLESLGLAFSVWESGGKGYHVCIKTEPMFGPHVPASHAAWVSANSPVKADMSLYQHGRIFSNPGRIHEKSGKTKKKVYEHAGKLLSVPAVSWEPPAPLSIENPAEKGRAGLVRCARLLLDEPSEGNRHTAIWSTAGLLAEAGLDQETARGLMTWINNLWTNPKSAEAVNVAIEQAYRQARDSRPA